MFKKNKEDAIAPLKKQFALGIFAFLVCPAFLLSTLFFIFSQGQKVVEEKVRKLERKTSSLAKMNLKRVEQQKKYERSDPDYLSKYVEPLNFLATDIEMLSQIQNNSDAFQYRPLQQRLEFLQGGENRLRFVENEKRNTETLLEREFALQGPVEVDAKDIGKILSLVEGISIGESVSHPYRPNLIIKKIDLIKKEGGEEDELYTLNLQLIQRGCYEEN